MQIQNVAKMIDLNQFDAARLCRASKDKGLSPEKCVKDLVSSFLSSKGYHNPARVVPGSRVSLRA